MRATAVLIALAFPATAGAAPPAYTFSTGNPDGRMAMASRPDSAGKAEIEAADDFSVERETQISGATVTGLLPTSSTLSDVARVEAEIYRVFPLDSNATPSGNVPTRANSPSDTAFAARDTLDGGLSFGASVLSGSFLAANSVLNGIHAKPGQTTGGEGAVSGQEVRFDLTFAKPIVLPAGEYFLVPQVQLVSSGNFYWLSAPRPIVAPGTPFSPDLQAWMRNAALAPDWLRVGTDIVGGATPPSFNGALSLDGIADCRTLDVAATTPDGTVGVPYDGAFTASGGTGADTFSATDLPGGLSVASNGAITGTPTDAGTFATLATATDAEGCRTSLHAPISIHAAATQQQGGGGSTPAVLSKLSLEPPRFRAARGSHIHFTLSAASAVTLTIQRRVAGRHRTHRFVRLKGVLTDQGKPGANVMRFTARLRGHRLHRGRYRLLARPAGGSSKSTAFRIL